MHENTVNTVCLPSRHFYLVRFSICTHTITSISDVILRMKNYLVADHCLVCVPQLT